MNYKSAKKIRIQHLALYFLIFFISISCNQSIESKTNNSIQNLIAKYPQLTSEKKSEKSKEFAFVKSVREGQFNIEIQLYSQPEGYKNRNHILVFINGKKDIYAVPLFNNKYKDYWEFPFDKLLNEIPKTNTTFSNELNLAINNLINNNDRNKSQKRWQMINLALNSVLNCKNLQEKDSVMIYKSPIGNFNLPDEDMDSVSIRLRKNYELMKRQWQPNFPSNCFFDETNSRIYQVEYRGNKVKIKAYRQDYGMHFIYL